MFLTAARAIDMCDTIVCVTNRCAGDRYVLHYSLFLTAARAIDICDTVLYVFLHYKYCACINPSTIFVLISTVLVLSQVPYLCF